MSGEKAAAVALQAGGVLMILTGLLMAVLLGSLYYVGPIYVVLGILLIIFGLIWLRNARRTAKRIAYRQSRKRTVKAVAAALLALALLPVEVTGLASLGGVMVARAQGTTNLTASYCYTAYVYTTYAQYIILGFMVVLAVLAFIPLVLGRTPLGALFADFSSGLTFTVLVFLIFAMLFLFPINALFVGSYGGPTPSSCYISLSNLETNGPPLLRALLSILTNLVPPPPNVSATTTTP